MAESTVRLSGESLWQREDMGPATLTQVLAEMEQQVANGDVIRFLPLATGFVPLDEVLNGGLRPGELLILGGPYGVGKTIWGLQVARNVVRSDEGTRALYICYEHDRMHLMSRLLCLESAEQECGEDALTLRKLEDLAFNPGDDGGFVSRLRRVPGCEAVLESLNAYAERLVLVKASGVYSTLAQIRQWVQEVMDAGPQRLLVVVDYLQKIPANRELLQTENEVTTALTHGLKEIAMFSGSRVIVIAASDRPGMRAKRMRLSDLRGSSALQYEADIGLIINNKHDIVSREHLVYNLAQAETMRNWVVLSVEKNRAGRTAIDMEFALDAAHFRMIPTGRFVRERLIDGRLIQA